MNEEKWTCERNAWTVEIFRNQSRIVKFNAAEILHILERPDFTDIARNQEDRDKITYGFEGLMNILTRYANIICEARNKE